ncbi:RsiV family protein [Pseudomonas sp.]|uniref:RsiV family protein n=1 Tax=Pseudomonas sp. TaxID=306 RepID=UPI00257D039A|nr:RsiV family protein [Pseudomonas sp.]
MSLTKLLAIAGFGLILGGCQSLLPQQEPLQPKRVAWEHRLPGCAGESCPLVNIDKLKFANNPQLDELVEKRLLSMTQNSPDAPQPTSLESFEKDFLQNAEPGWKTYLQAKLIDQHDDVAVIEFSSYIDTGGNHGMPGRGFINYDRDTGKVLTLSDILLPNRSGAFWAQVEQAHKRWLAKNQLDKDPSFVKDWPFRETQNIALTRDQLLLKYDVLTLGPYSNGHPSLTIPYAQLKGILKPEFLPES